MKFLYFLPVVPFTLFITTSVFAQSAPVDNPIFYCVGSNFQAPCTTPFPTEPQHGPVIVAAPSPTSAALNTSVNLSVTSTTQPTLTTAPQPANEPCTTSQPTNLTLLEQLIQLIQEILQLLGLSQIITPTPQPCPQPTPTITLTPPTLTPTPVPTDTPTPTPTSTPTPTPTAVPVVSMQPSIYPSIIVPPYVTPIVIPCVSNQTNRTEQYQTKHGNTRTTYEPIKLTLLQEIYQLILQLLQLLGIQIPGIVTTCPPVVNSLNVVKGFDTDATLTQQWFNDMAADGFKVYINDSITWNTECTGSGDCGLNTCTFWAPEMQQIQYAINAGMEIGIYNMNPSCWSNGLNGFGSHLKDVKFYVIDLNNNPNDVPTQAMVSGIEALGVQPVILTSQAAWSKNTNNSTAFSTIPLQDETSTDNVTYANWVPSLLTPAPQEYGGWNIPNSESSTGFDNLRVINRQAQSISMFGQPVDLDSINASWLAGLASFSSLTPTPQEPTPVLSTAPALSPTATSNPSPTPIVIPCISNTAANQNLLQQLYQYLLQLIQKLGISIPVTITPCPQPTPSVTPTPTSNAGVNTAECPNVVVPAYFNPQQDWQTLLKSSDSPSSVGFIFNPASGPGTSANPHMQLVAQTANANNKTSYAYVSTTYGKTSIESVESQINEYKTLYGETNILLDQMSPNASDLAYYQSLISYIHTNSPDSKVFLDPGSYPNPSYMNLDGTFTVFVGRYSSFANTKPPGWVRSTPASKLSVVVYDTPSKDLKHALNIAKSDNAGTVYFTDNNNLGNPYNSLPGYWSTELSDIAGNCTE